MPRLKQLASDAAAWILAINGAVLVASLCAMFSIALVGSGAQAMAGYQWMERWHTSEIAAALSLVIGVFFAVRPPRNVEKARYWLQVVMRYALAYVYLDYGLSKVFKGQFTTSLSTLETPLGDISGFSLAWRFFGYSYIYVIFLAASEVVGALLLFRRRTTLLAAAILLPVAVNVAVVNYTHGIGVLAEAILLLLMTAYLFLLDFPRLKAVFWDHAAIGPRTFAEYWTGGGLRALRYAAIAFIVLFTLTENVVLYLRYERTTTPLHGVWIVEDYRVNGVARADASTWTKLYVDTDRTLSIRTAKALQEYMSDVTLGAGHRPIKLTEAYTDNLALAGVFDLRTPNALVFRGKHGADAITVALKRAQSGKH